jgi:hypothetical protein
MFSTTNNLKGKVNSLAGKWQVKLQGLFVGSSSQVSL